MLAMHALRLLGLMALARASSVKRKSSLVPSAEVFVINLDNRTDKCRCMQHQLMDSPWPVHRFRAMNRETVVNKCPVMAKSDDDAQKKANAALMCSNKLVWERFLAQSKADYLVLFEDDAVVLDRSIWDRLSNLMTKPCKKWDYLMVDPWGGPWTNRTSCGDIDLFALDFDKCGSHLQVFPRRILKSLIKFAETDHGFLPVADKYFEVFRQESQIQIDAYAVVANIATQAELYKQFTGTLLNCEATVTTQEDRMKRLKTARPVFDVIMEPPFEC